MSRFWLCACAGVAAAFAVAVAVPAHAAAAAEPRCATSGLVVWLDTNGDGTAGSTYFRLELTNLSSRRCTLVGYPGISAVGLDGRQLGSAAARTRRTPVRTVVLASGGTVTAMLQVADTSVFDKASCRPVTAAGLRVYPPNQRESKVVPFPFRACSRTGRTYLHVAAVTKST